MSFDPIHLTAILGMAAVTLAMRFGGYLLVRYVTVTGRAAAAMEAMPVAVLTALVVPTALATGPAETIAAAVTLFAAWRLPIIVAVIIGTAAVVVLRLGLS
ncbi:MAG: AzlD domain-containing protein [Alphaproteobacteria bacterium]|nr:AzlD domain-containing protein [Alphaproteobacteria bacterium]